MTKTKKLVSVFIILLGVSLVLGCTAPDLKEGKKTLKADGKELYDHITVQNNYTNWSLWPGKEKMQSSREPHGNYATTYISETALASLDSKQGNMSEGSIIVRESYNSDKALANIYAMYKSSGYDPENNDWFWVTYSPDGNVEAEGKLETCLECHGFKNKNDFIFASPLDKGSEYAIAAAATPTPEPTPEPTPRRAPMNYTIQIKGHTFQPPWNKEILAGDTVIWQNREEFKNPRNLISDDGLWEVPAHINFMREFSYTFNQTGTYTFRLQYNEARSQQTITVI